MNLNKYTFALIYKVSSKIGNCVYYGSTTDLMERIRKHKSDFKYNRSCYSKYVLKYPDYKFEIVEYYSCESKKQLDRREGYYQRNFDCVNKVVAGRTSKEYREDNKEKISNTHKIYYEKHKETLINKQKKYYQNNKDIINKKQREKFICACGGKYARAHISTHKKTKKHMKYVESLNITI